MEEKKTKKRASTATIRKASTHGVTSQKACTFKIDLEVITHLEHEVNKGRLINNLLRKYYGIENNVEPNEK